MSQFIYPIVFSEDHSSQIRGHLQLDEPLPFHNNSRGSGFYRPGEDCSGRVHGFRYSPLSQCGNLFFHLYAESPVDANLLDIVGLSPEEISKISSLRLPGQLCMGSDRSKVIRRAIKDLFAHLP